MIIDTTWIKSKKELVISYTNKQGKREFMRKTLHHIKTYEYDSNGEVETWNGKRAKVVFKDTSKYVPNDFDIYEYLYNLPKDTQKLLHSAYFPELYTFDIETAISKKFPDPNFAEQEVTAISIVGPDGSCLVLGLQDMNDTQKQLFESRYKDYIQNNQFANKIININSIKVLYQSFKSEEELIIHFFKKIIPNIAVLAGWNSYRFDWVYLTNRLKRICGPDKAKNIIRSASPTFQTQFTSYIEHNTETVKISVPSHSILFDYMELVKKYDYSIAQKESLSLDWISNAAFGAHKIEYKGSLQQLYERDSDMYYFYNAVDSLLVHLIHKKLKCLENPCACGAITLVPILKCLGQVVLGTAAIFAEFYKDNKHIVYNMDEINRIRQNYQGAYVKETVPGRYEWVVCDDFASLYPSQIQTCNISFENFCWNYDKYGRHQPWSEEQLNEFKKDKNYFVSVNNNVYKNDRDYCFKKMQRNTKKRRDYYKYTGQKIDSELLPFIEKLINKK